ncbi:MAG: deoxyribodipyrimidine photo-lyase [Woeseiaceae bacterium]|nr:deoxyribodipyrimidine photo-lyase [Woeseiaceae bacterium]
MQPVLLWFRRNLRLADNDALIAAAESGRPIVPVYIVDAQDSGRAGRWWLHNSLESLDSELRGLGGGLVIRSGEPESVLPEMAAQAGASAIFYCRRHEPAGRKQEDRLREKLPSEISVNESMDGLLHDPDSIATSTGTRYRIYTSFWKAASGSIDVPAPRPAPESVALARHSLESQSLQDLSLITTKDGIPSGFQEAWVPGESAGLERIDDLESIVRRYPEDRDRPDIQGTSRLSPYLHFGEVSPRQVWHAAHRLELQARASRGSEALIRQLWWREFSSYLLHHFPQLPERPLRDEFGEFPWIDRTEDLEAWQQGRTGYPIVDAGMRQLSETGWMHNRVRMVAASFLTKHLLVPWQKGAAWFLDNLVDADLANNSASWQWVAGCGTDAAPYFRIFNPALQAQKFDPQGSYVRRWVPEVADSTYPLPIVDHKAARQRALDAYQSIRGNRASKHAP